MSRHRTGKAAAAAILTELGAGRVLREAGWGRGSPPSDSLGGGSGERSPAAAPGETERSCLLYGEQQLVAEVTSCSQPRRDSVARVEIAEGGAGRFWRRQESSTDRMHSGARGLQLLFPCS